MSGVAIEEEDRLDPEQAKRVLRRTFRMLRPYRAQVIVASLVMIASTVALLAGPLIVRYAIDEGLGGQDGVEFAVDGALTRAALAYLAVAVAGLVLMRTQILMVTQIGERFLRDLRERVFDHILSMSQGFFDREPTGKLVARMTADIEILTELVQQGLVLFVTNGLLFILSVFILISLSPLLSAFCLIAVPVVVVASVKFRSASNRAYLEVRDKIGQTMSTLQEGISGVRVIQAFGQEEFQEQRFGSHNRAQLDANMYATKVSARYFPVIEMAGIGTTAAIVGFGGILVHQGRVTVGTVVAFVLYLAYLFEPIQQLSQLFNVLQQSGAALAKLFDVLDTTSPVRERPGAVDLPGKGAIEVVDVGFSYDGKNQVISDVNLRIAHGERLALVGPTGAGKSTLAKLMARMYDPTEGNISYAGVDLRDATLRSLRERIAVVPQEGFLFNGSILENVRIGREGATDEEVREALRLIGCDERFAQLADGLHTEVQERGSRLSAGEKLLVSLARAALAAPDVLVLDEATSNLDPGTEVDVENAMVALMEGRTVIVIAHRLSTAERSDRVAVVDAGGLVELGTHDELVSLGGRYAALFSTWMGGMAPTPGGS